MTAKQSNYRPISDYGIIGNCRSSALVSSDASIDFMCLPNFDSGAYLCSILDNETGGFFKIAPKGSFKTHQYYLDKSNVLETVFFSPQGRVTVTDLMPLSKEEDDNNHVKEFGTKIIRLVKASRGSHQFTLTLKVTPDFAREKPTITQKDGMVIIKDFKYQLILNKKHHRVEANKDTVTVEFKLDEGQQEFFSLDFYPVDYIPPVLSKADLNADLAQKYHETINFWKHWVSLCTYRGKYQNQVIRSALTLKLLTFTPTGAIVAASTTSLPEKIRGNLNWDYRYTWLRDASFTVYAFLGLGYLKEAGRFIEWLEEVCAREGTTIKIMYGIHGEEELTEQILPHLKGYMNSKPVRTGNEAATQKQFDVYGEVLTSINMYVHSGGKVNEEIKEFIKKLVNYCCVHWKEPDAGIWEPRYGDKHNTYSKLMCWVGIDRGIRIAKKLKIKDVDFNCWEKTREQIKTDILENGFDKQLNSFVAYYGSKVLDTSTLNIPIVGLLPSDDPRVLSTLDRIMEELVIDWFVLRTSDTENKLQEGEGTFFLSTFWLIDCLSLLGRVDEATVWIEKIIHDSTPLGLYAEEFDPFSKTHLGNFPQAFTHLGLINSILNLQQAEVFGRESKATIPTERLAKVIKSILLTRVDDKDFAKRSIGRIKRIFRRI